MLKAQRQAWESRRIERRERRRAQFSKPLDSSEDRLRAWWSMLAVDHGVFRVVYLNKHRVGAHAMRSAQPTPGQIRRMAAEGVRTVVNLRGGREFGSYPLEVEACRDAGLAFEEITLRSREAPSVATIEAAAALLDRIEYPALFHCKSGADRAGLMSALYLLLREGASSAEAQAQLSIWYGHFRAAKTGILDAFVDAFAEAERAAAAKGETLDFLTWVRRDYDPEAVTAAFRSKGWGRFLVDRILGRE